MYLGRLCEVGPADEVYAHPRHPYTVELLDAVPRIEQDQRYGAAAGETAEPAEPAEAPSPVNPPSGCRFRTRCPRAQLRCAEETPLLAPGAGAGPGHLVACHFPITADQPQPGRKLEPGVANPMTTASSSS
jgi:oligopeptide/dipeptide ABC transporter ATP-binding protein